MRGLHAPFSAAAGKPEAGALIDAVKRNDDLDVRDFLQRGADVNEKDEFEFVDR